MYNLSFTTVVPVQFVIMLDWIPFFSSLDSSSSESIIIEGISLLSMQFSFPYSFFICNTWSSAYAQTSFVILIKWSSSSLLKLKKLRFNTMFLQSFDKSFVLLILAMFIYFKMSKNRFMKKFYVRKILKFKNGVAKYACTRVSVSIKVRFTWLLPLVSLLPPLFWR